MILLYLFIGIGHGIRRMVGGIASIMGPLWASSLLTSEYLMLGVMLGLNCLAVVSQTRV